MVFSDCICVQLWFDFLHFQLLEDGCVHGPLVCAAFSLVLICVLILLVVVCCVCLADIDRHLHLLDLNEDFIILSTNERLASARLRALAETP
jgi:hypothetical protein